LALSSFFSSGDETGTHLQRKSPAGFTIPESRQGWFNIWNSVREAFTGAWQQNVSTPICDVLQHPTVFACITLIAGDMAKMRWDLTQAIGNDVWMPVENPAFSPFLRRPNHFQTDFQFREHWATSKLIYGNTYALKQRDLRGLVTAAHVLDPRRVLPLVAPDGSVFYELKMDDLAQQPRENVVVPAREIFHDRFNCFYHPLVGIGPLFAAGIPAMLGLKILKSSNHFFGNGAMPGGILYVPGVLDQAKADDLKARWDTNYGGANYGSVAILPDGLRFEVTTQPADKSQLSEQWDKASQAIATAFKVPFYMVGGPPPPYNNPQSQSVEYLTRCLQPLIVGEETCLDDGLGLTPDKINGVQYGVQLKTSDLLLMDTLTMMTVLRDGVSAGLLKPNDGRAQLNYPPVEGGETPYLQVQNYSLAALAKRDQEQPIPATPAINGNVTTSASDTSQQENQAANISLEAPDFLRKALVA
jgi:HK97 family phage portal protein